jgi:type II secretory pathway component PulC
VVTRSMLRGTVEHGIGAFLSYVTVSPVLNRGHFVGFRLDQVRALARLTAAGIDLRIGDVVTRVNGQSIERPEYAQRVFQGLAERDDVVMDVLRGQTTLVVRVPVAPDVQPPTTRLTPVVQATAVR